MYLLNKTKTNIKLKFTFSKLSLLRFRYSRRNRNELTCISIDKNINEKHCRIRRLVNDYKTLSRIEILLKTIARLFIISFLRRFICVWFLEILLKLLAYIIRIVNLVISFSISTSARTARRAFYAFLFYYFNYYNPMSASVYGKIKNKYKYRLS